MTKPEKNRGGRPTDYSKEMLTKAQEYVASCVDKVVMEKGKVVDIKVDFPTSEGLARHLDVARKTLYNWADKHVEFLHILEAVNSEQVKRLINRGLSGHYNPTIAKLVLAKHGYKESSEVDVTSGGKRIGGFEYIKPHETNNPPNAQAT